MASLASEIAREVRCHGVSYAGLGEVFAVQNLRDAPKQARYWPRKHLFSARAHLFSYDKNCRRACWKVLSHGRGFLAYHRWSLSCPPEGSSYEKRRRWREKKFFSCEKRCFSTRSGCFSYQKNRPQTPSPALLRAPGKRRNPVLARVSRVFGVRRAKGATCFTPGRRDDCPMWGRPITQTTRFPVGFLLER